MHHYERAGELAKAEDALFAVLDAESDRGPLLEFGMAFYRRLQSKSDAALAEAQVEPAEASLEDVFIHHTGKSIREEEVKKISFLVGAGVPQSFGR